MWIVFMRTAEIKMIKSMFSSFSRFSEVFRVGFFFFFFCSFIIQTYRMLMQKVVCCVCVCVLQPASSTETMNKCKYNLSEALCDDIDLIQFVTL